MAAKFDGKHARANMWVTHQNLARAKGGRPHYQFKEKAPRVKPASTSSAPVPAETVVTTPAPAPAAEASKG